MHKYICEILKHSMQYFFSQNPQKLPLFQAVKLVVPLKKHNNKIAVECIQDIEPNHENSN